MIVKKLFISILLLLSLPSFGASNSNPGFVFGQVPTPTQWNSYFSAKLDYLPGAINTIPYWDGSGNILNAIISGDCTSVANVFTCTGTHVNLTGPITSVGSATSVASQTGTGSTFVMNASPTLVTPNLGTPSAVVLTNASGTASSLTAGEATNIAGGAAGQVPYQTAAGATGFSNISQSATGGRILVNAPTDDGSTEVQVNGSVSAAGNVTITSGALRGSYGAGGITTNFAAGDGALQSNTTGYYNAATGVNALYNNTTGYQNTATGGNALFSNTTGYQNTASGVSALYGNTAGTANTAAGFQALQSNTTGYYNTATGFQALANNTAGTANTAAGVGALISNTTGYQNTASGVSALYGNTTGNDNTALGLQAGYGTGTNANTTGSNNTFLGYQTVGAGAGDTNEIVIGANAVGLGSNTSVIGNSATVKTQLFGVVAHPTGYTVATLPAGVLGDMTYVTDATAPTYNGALTGGGAVTIPVFYNGTAWVSH